MLSFNYFKKSLLIIPCLIIVAACKTPTNQNFDDRKVAFNNDWHFFLSDTLTGKDSIDQTTVWRKLSLPHDWSIEQNFDEKSPAGIGGGALSGGVNPPGF